MRVENMRVPDWKDVDEAVAEVISESSDPFDPATLANVQDLIEACRDSCRAPEQVDKGYWSTVCLSWENVEIEVCEDRYELYRF